MSEKETQLGSLVYQATRTLPDVIGDINAALTHVDVLVFGFNLVGFSFSAADLTKLKTALSSKGLLIYHHEVKANGDGTLSLVINIEQATSMCDALVISALSFLVVTGVAVFIWWAFDSGTSL